jgi:hypothetical protein
VAGGAPLSVSRQLAWMPKLANLTVAWVRKLEAEDSFWSG